MSKGHGYIVRVVREDGDFWLGTRVYLKLASAQVVRRNLTENNPLNPQRYLRVYIVPATQEQRKSALSVIE